MPRAGFCSECKTYVWVTDDGACQFGHPRAAISGTYMAEAPDVSEPVADCLVPESEAEATWWFEPLAVYDMLHAPDTWVWDDCDLAANRVINGKLFSVENGPPWDAGPPPSTKLWKSTGGRIPLQHGPWVPCYFPEEPKDMAVTHGKHTWVTQDASVFRDKILRDRSWSLMGGAVTIRNDDSFDYLARSAALFFAPARYLSYLEHHVSGLSDFATSPDTRRAMRCGWLGSCITESPEVAAQWLDDSAGVQALPESAAGLLRLLLGNAIGRFSPL